jgi:hypothetical protein
MRPITRNLLLSLVLAAATTQVIVAQAAAKPAAPKPAPKKGELKKPTGKDTKKEETPPEQEFTGQQNAANNYGRPWKRSQLDLRVGLLGGPIIPIGQASKVLETGWGGRLWASAETSFIKLPKSKIFENTLLIYEFSFYKVKGTSVTSKIGQDTDADFVTNAGAIGKAYDVPFSPKFVMRFVPYFGLGLTNITSDTKLASGQTVRAISGDIIVKYGVAAAYDFDRRWQALLTLDHYIYFEEKIGMSLRINLGATMMIF